MISTKSEVLNYIANLTFDIKLNHGEDLTAFSVAQKLSISRSLASQYLNELVRDGKLIKIKTRPVIFLHKEILLHSYNGVTLTNEYLSVAQFKRAINHHKRVGDFRGLVGYNISLDSVIKKAKASVSHYPNVMPLLMVGNSGVGKSSIAYESYAYSVIKGFLKSGSKYESIDVNDESSYFKIIDNNSDFLYVSNLQYLSEDKIKKLLDHVKLSKNKVFMFSTNDISLTEYFPLNVKISDYSKRYDVEKLNIVVSIMKDYASSLKISLFTKKSVLKSLIEISYDENISSIKNIIHKIIGETRTQNNDIYIDIQNIYDLISDERLPYFINKSKEEDFENIHKFNNNEELIIKVYQSLLDDDFSEASINKFCKEIIGEYNFDRYLISNLRKDIAHLVNVNPSINQNIEDIHLDLVAYIVYLEKMFGNKLYHILNYNNEDLMKYFNRVVLEDPNIHISIKNLMKYLSDYLNYDFHIINIIIILKVMQKTV